MPMEFTVRRVNEEHERTLVFGVSGVGKVEHPDFPTIEGEGVIVELERDEDRAPWRVYMVTLSGPRILKNNKPGARHESHSYTDESIVNDPHAPKWLTALADKALRKAEADRHGFTPPCPKCGMPSILADPLRPEESGEYCEPCAWHFDAGNGLCQSHAARRLSGLPPVLVPDDDSASTVTLTASMCRTCGDNSGWHQEDGTVYVWQDNHGKVDGHVTFHMWRFERNEARLLYVPA